MAGERQRCCEISCGVCPIRGGGFYQARQQNASIAEPALSYRCVAQSKVVSSSCMGESNGHCNGYSQFAAEPIQQRDDADCCARTASRRVSRESIRTGISSTRSGGHRVDEHCGTRRRNYCRASGTSGTNSPSHPDSAKEPPLKYRSVYSATPAVRYADLRQESGYCQVPRTILPSVHIRKLILW